MVGPMILGQIFFARCDIKHVAKLASQKSHRITQPGTTTSRMLVAGQVGKTPGPEGVALDQLIEEAVRENPRGDPDSYFVHHQGE